MTPKNTIAARSGCRATTTPSPADFVTIVTCQRLPLFGEILNENIQLAPLKVKSSGKNGPDLLKCVVKSN